MNFEWVGLGRTLAGLAQLRLFRLAWAASPGLARQEKSRESLRIMVHAENIAESTKGTTLLDNLGILSEMNENQHPTQASQGRFVGPGPARQPRPA